MIIMFRNQKGMEILSQKWFMKLNDLRLLHCFFDYPSSFFISFLRSARHNYVHPTSWLNLMMIIFQFNSFFHIIHFLNNPISHYPPACPLHWQSAVFVVRIMMDRWTCRDYPLNYWNPQMPSSSVNASVPCSEASHVHKYVFQHNYVIYLHLRLAEMPMN